MLMSFTCKKLAPCQHALWNRCLLPQIMDFFATTHRTGPHIRLQHNRRLNHTMCARIWSDKRRSSVTNNGNIMASLIYSPNIYVHAQTVRDPPAPSTERQQCRDKSAANEIRGHSAAGVSMPYLAIKIYS